MSTTKIRCEVKAGVKREQSIELFDDIYMISVKTQAVEGRANEAVRQILAKHLEIAPSRVKLVRGHRSRHKTFEIIY